MMITPRVCHRDIRAARLSQKEADSSLLSFGLLADKSKGTPVGCPLLYEKNFSVIDFLILVARLARKLEAELI